MSKRVKNVAWTHPSWRDLIIDHLATSPADRHLFLSKCSIEGVKLALSSAGGARGTRSTPLLPEPEDWDVLGTRLSSLIREYPHEHELPALGSIRQAIKKHGNVPLKADDPLARLTRQCLNAINSAWNNSGRAIPVNLLASYIEASIALSPIPPLPDLRSTWDTLYTSAIDEMGYDEDGDEPLLSHTFDWLEFCDLLRGAEPRFLVQVQFPAIYTDAPTKVLGRVRFWIARDITGFSANAALNAIDSIGWLALMLDRIAVLFPILSEHAKELSASVRSLAGPLEQQKQKALFEEGADSDPPDRDDLDSTYEDGEYFSITELFKDL